MISWCHKNQTIFFKKATKTLNVIENSYLTNNANQVLDPVDKAIKLVKESSQYLGKKEDALIKGERKTYLENC